MAEADSNAILYAKWLQPAATLKLESKHFIHKFVNKSRHRLTFAAKHFDSGEWWERPPPAIEPRTTVAWGSCGKKGFMGVTSGTGGTVIL